MSNTSLSLSQAWEKRNAKRAHGKPLQHPAQMSTRLTGVEAEQIYDLNSPAVVKFAYNAEREDELSLVKGAQLMVMEKCSDGWWRGSYNGQMGWFPSNYVQEEEVEDTSADLPAVFSSRLGLSNGQGPRVLHTVSDALPLQFRHG